MDKKLEEFAAFYSEFKKKLPCATNDNLIMFLEYRKAMALEGILKELKKRKGFK